jgi:vancomycin resistance protein VanJ
VVKFRRADILIFIATAAYGLLLLVAGLALYVAADSRWWATLLLFVPRWIWAIPLAPLAVAAAFRRRRLWLACLVPLAAGALFLSNVHCPWRTLFEPPSAPPTLRILSCNCDYGSLDFAALGRLVAGEKPDLVALQDVDVRQLPAMFPAPEWHLQLDSRLSLASRFPIRATVRADNAGFGKFSQDIVRYELDIGGNTVQLFNLHLATPRFGLEAVRTQFWNGADKLQEASDARRLQARSASRWMSDFHDVVVTGDFNTPPESPLYRESFGRYANAFSVAGWGVGNTYFRGYNRLRLDHVLYDEHWQCRACWIGPDVGSEHRPVMAVLTRVAK